MELNQKSKPVYFFLQGILALLLVSALNISIKTILVDSRDLSDEINIGYSLLSQMCNFSSDEAVVYLLFRLVFFMSFSIGAIVLFVKKRYLIVLILITVIWLVYSLLLIFEDSIRYHV